MTKTQDNGTLPANFFNEKTNQTPMSFDYSNYTAITPGDFTYIPHSSLLRISNDEVPANFFDGC